MLLFKKSYIRDEINVFITSIVLFFFRKKFRGKKILIKMTDGMGDILIRSKLIEKIKEEYGEENVIFIIKKEYEFLGKILDIPVITFTKGDKYNLYKRIKTMYKINLLGIKKFINIEWSNDDFIRNIYAEEKIAIEALQKEDYKNNKACTRKLCIRKEENFNNEKRKVLDFLVDIGNSILKNKVDIDSITPDLREKFPIEKVNEGIVIAIGASDRNRVCSPYKLGEYIKEIIKEYPDEDIYLVGNGERQKKYSKKLKEIVFSDKIIDLVDKISLEEALELVAKAKLFIGFDSGLYNFRYTLRKKQIALFQSKNVPYSHIDNSLIVLEGGEEVKNIFDEEYPNEKINSISITKFKNALVEIKERKYK